MIACNTKENETSKTFVSNDSSLIYLEKLINQTKERGEYVPEIFERIVYNKDSSSTLIQNIKNEFENQKKNISYSYYDGLGKIVSTNDLNYIGEERYIFSIRRSFERFNFIFKIEASLDTLSKSFSYLLTINRTMSDRYKHALLLDTIKNRKLLKDTILLEEQIHVTKQNWNEFTSRIDQSDFWVLGENKHNYTDGSAWILEGAACIPSGNLDKPLIKYHRVYRQSPNKGSFQNACLYLIDLYNKDIGQIY
jgi:hypothetical protein